MLIGAELAEAVITAVREPVVEPAESTEVKVIVNAGDAAPKADCTATNAMTPTPSVYRGSVTVLFKVVGVPVTTIDG